MSLLSRLPTSQSPQSRIVKSNYLFFGTKKLAWLLTSILTSSIFALLGNNPYFENEKWAKDPYFHLKSFIMYTYSRYIKQKLWHFWFSKSFTDLYMHSKIWYATVASLICLTWTNGQKRGMLLIFERIIPWLRSLRSKLGFGVTIFSRLEAKNETHLMLFLQAGENVCPKTHLLILECTKVINKILFWLFLAIDTTFHFHLISYVCILYYHWLIQAHAQKA